eukprot:symbB.v1.2.001289.t1/scaffold68.1/size354569/11
MTPYREIWSSTLEVTVAQSVDKRLQVVEEALLEMNQDLLAAASQIRHLEARNDTPVTDFEKEARLMALEDWSGKSDAQSKELHTLCLVRCPGLSPQWQFSIESYTV